MKNFYKINNGELITGQGKTIPEGFTEYDPQNPPSELEKLDHSSQAKRILELKLLLNASDYKVLPDYDGDSETIKLERQAWREEIRELESQL